MMRSWVYILLSGLFGFQSFAQHANYFDTIYYSGGNRAELLVLDSGYVTMVRGVEDTVLQIWEVDKKGATVSFQPFSTNALIGNCGNCFERINPKRFIYAHTLFYTIDSANVQLVKFNPVWDTVKTCNYYFGNTVTTQVYGMKKEKDKILVTGYTYPDSNRYQLLLACFDTALNLLWEKSYARASGGIGGLWGFSIEPTADGGYLIGGLNTTFPTWNVTNKGMLLKTDSSGNEQWRKTLSYPTNNGGALRLAKRSDGNFLFIGPQGVFGGGELTALE